MSQQAEKLGPSRTSSSLFSAALNRPFPHITSLPAHQTRAPFHLWLSLSLFFFLICVFVLYNHLCVLAPPPPFILPLWFFDPRHQNGGIRTISDLRHYVRDHQPVRLAQSWSPWTIIKSRNTKCRRYTDLQPVGMGAFGLVW